VKVLVTGATGFLGSALVERLLARGEKDVRCLVRTGGDRSRLDEAAAAHPGAAVERFVGSLASKDAAAAAIEGVGVVYHLAASLAGAPADLFLNTVVTSKHLLDAVADSLGGAPSSGRIKIVLVSSFGVYGVADLPRGALEDESTPLEAHPERRDVYSQAKLRQEKLFHEYQQRLGFPLVVLRPGVIYGRGGSPMSTRVGLDLAGVFLNLGGDNLLPLTYVDNCAEAVAIAGQTNAANGQVYNVVDDDLITAGEYLRRYRRAVKPLRAVSVPYAALLLGSRLLERYHRWSKGQLPAAFTPYKVATSWKGKTFTNAKLKSLGWRPLVSTDEGLRLAFDHHRARRN
jgi:nucleoside-diphosphate-sugar epimerase